MADGPEDQRRFVSALVRPEALRHWDGAAAPYDIYDAKGEVFRSCWKPLGQDPTRLMVMEPTADHWHPGRAATLRLGPKNVIAQFGELHPRVVKALGAEGRLIGFEVNLDAIPLPRAAGVKTKPVLEKLDLTPVRRDFAFVVEDTLNAGELIKAAMGADKNLIASVDVFDIYAGKGISEGHKSVAIEVTIQPKEATLTDDQIDAISKKIIASAEKLGGQLRG